MKNEVPIASSQIERGSGLPAPSDGEGSPMRRAHLLRLNLGASTVRRLLWIIAGINIVILIGTYPDRSWGNIHWRIRYLGRELDLGLENNLAAWYSAILMLTVAASMLLCFILDRRAERASPGPRPAARLLTFGWIGLALAFALLSWDELGSLHERVDEIPWAKTLLPSVGGGLKGWVAVLAIPIGLVGLGMLAFAWARVRESRAALIMMSVAVFLYLTVPMQENIEAVLRGATLAKGENWHRPMFHSVLEEGAEVFGTLLFLAAGLTYARHRLRQLERSGAGERDTVILPVRLFHVALVGAVLALGLLSVHVLLPHLMWSEDLHGVPQNWFPVVLSALAAAACAAAASVHSRRTAVGMLLLMFANLALSINHASDYSWQNEMLTSASLGRLVDAAIVAALLLAAAIAVAGTRVRGARFAILTWAVLITLSWVASPGDGTQTVLSFVAYLALLPAPILMLPGAMAINVPRASTADSV